MSNYNKGQSLTRGYNINSREHSNIVFETVEKSATTSHLHSIQRSMNSDASRVSVSGNGIKKAFRNQKAQFTVDTRNAGKRMLEIRLERGMCIMAIGSDL